MKLSSLKNQEKTASFKINDGVYYTIDTMGVAILDKRNNNHFFLLYPEAAVFSMLFGSHNKTISRQMLQVILDKTKVDTERFIGCCINKWRDLNIISEDGKSFNNKSLQ
jgi:hypothetical protein